MKTVGENIKAYRKARKLSQQQIGDVIGLQFYCRYDGFTADWFVFGGIKPLPETTITKRKDAYCKQANVKNIRIHDFRHSCASYYIHNNASPTVLAKLLGHSSAKMTLDTYSHFYTSDLRDLVDNCM